MFVMLSILRLRRLLVVMGMIMVIMFIVAMIVGNGFFRVLVVIVGCVVVVVSVMLIGGLVICLSVCLRFLIGILFLSVASELWPYLKCDWNLLKVYQIVLLIPLMIIFQKL